MTLRAIAAAGTLAALFQPPQAAPFPCDASPLLIRNANVWTARGVLPRHDVLVRDGRVAAVGPNRPVPDASLRTLDGSGHTLLPGLIDSHLHFVVPGGLPRASAPPPDVAAITGRQLLRSGVTSGRLHLATLDEAVALKSRSAAACAPLPRLQAGGPALSGASDRDAGSFQGAASPQSAAAKLERFGAAGLEWVAIHDADKFGPGVIDAIRDTARRVGLRIMAAGATPAEIIAALAVNPDTLDYFDRSAGPYGAPVLDLIRARRGLVLVPTPGVPYRTAAYLRDSAALDRPENFELLPTGDRRFVLEAARTQLAGREGENAHRVMTLLPAKFAQLRSLGLAMAIGSDAGSPLHFQPNAIWWELEAWRSLGASHREALIAATENGARVLAWDDVGRLSVGARGDFVLYRGDVESGPFDAARVLAVGKDGVLFVERGTWLGF
jgi:imidazolonepropionase-like amidohydrolase